MQRRARAPARARPVSAAAALDQLDPVAVRVLDEAEPRAALADAVGLALGLDALVGQARQRAVEVVDADRDVAVAGAEVIRTPVVVVGQLQDRVVAAHREEVVRRLLLSVPDDVQLAVEREAERLVEGAAPAGIGDPDHRVQEGRGHCRHPTAHKAGVTKRALAILKSMLFKSLRKIEMISSDQALPGRSEEMPVPERHYVLDTPLKPPFPDGLEQLVVGMGCFWGAERVFWQAPGGCTPAVGYAGGYTPNPTYDEVCSGRTAHTEAVLVVFDPTQTSREEILRLFWENHDPTQGMRQGNDLGTQYRSAIYVADESQLTAAEASRDAY